METKARNRDRTTLVSNHLDPERCHPDVDLLERRFQPLLELAEEMKVFRRVLHVDENTGQVVAVFQVFVLPQPPNRLRFAGHGPEPLAQFQQCLPDECVGTARPSLNRRGRRISNRRNAPLIRGRPLDREGDPLNGQR